MPAATVPTAARVLVVSGAGAYSDPWHPFAETSARMASILGAHHATTVTSDVASALQALRPSEWDVVVLNFGSGEEPVETDAGCIDGLERYRAGGGAILASHVVATAFPDDERWERMLGGRWVRGTSMHPEFGEAQIHVTESVHPVTAGVSDFTLLDERYSDLRVSASVDVLATHEHDGREHALMWAHESGGARVVYDGLGHDPRSFESAEHRALLVNAVGWLSAGT